MSGQKFRATEPHQFANGAIGWSPGGPFDCLGPFAKVENCPIISTSERRTAYATGYADTVFSIPARAQLDGKTIRGYFTVTDDNCVFHQSLCNRPSMRTSENYQMINTTKAQRAALKAVYDRGPLVYTADMLVTPSCGQAPLTYKQFRAYVKPSFDCLMVPWQGMWLGIEPDGYTHS